MDEYESQDFTDKLALLNSKFIFISFFVCQGHLTWTVQNLTFRHRSTKVSRFKLNYFSFSTTQTNSIRAHQQQQHGNVPLENLVSSRQIKEKLPSNSGNIQQTRVRKKTFISWGHSVVLLLTCHLIPLVPTFYLGRQNISSIETKVSRQN